MRRFAIVGVGLLSISGFTGAALAADLPPGSEPQAPAAAPVTVYNWTGCYIGGHVGGLVSEDRTTNLLGTSVDFGTTGFAGGGQIGCDYQFARGWVAGLEGRAAWSSLSNTRAGTVRNIVTGVTVPSQFTLRNDLLSSATARLGHTSGDRLLVYARGGAAWTHQKMDDAFTTAGGLAVDPGVTQTRTGWTVGVGTEWAFAPHWSATLEYNYYDFGSGGTLLTSPTNNVTVTIFSLKETIHAVTAGVNYRF